jgi:hypothetical protein
VLVWCTYRVLYINLCCFLLQEELQRDTPQPSSSGGGGSGSGSGSGSGGSDSTVTAAGEAELGINTLAVLVKVCFFVVCF